MPCFEVRRSTLVLENVNQDFLAAGLKHLGLQVEARADGGLLFRDQRARSGTFLAGTLTFDPYLTTNEGFLTREKLKPAISAAVVEAAAKRFGWQASKSTSRSYLLQKRG